MALLLKWGPWLYGLVSAFIGGGAGAIVSTPVVTSLLDPMHDIPFFKAFGVLFVTHGATTAAAYLKQSPLPAQAEK